MIRSVFGTPVALAWTLLGSSGVILGGCVASENEGNQDHDEVQQLHAELAADDPDEAVKEGTANADPGAGGGISPNIHRPCEIEWGKFSCSTAELPANSSGHWIRIYADSFHDGNVICRLYDSSNGVQVGHVSDSAALPGGRSKTIYGLHGFYFAVCVRDKDGRAYGKIDN